MTWVSPSFSRSRVDVAGRVMSGLEHPKMPFEQALEIVNNWRASHSYPLNTFQMRLRRECLRIDDEAFVVQRIKRIPSVISKLRRFPDMNLSRMQDIGGCRAVVSSVHRVYQLHDNYLTSGIKHTLVNKKNYIHSPKTSGYRGIHLVYRYYSDKKTTHNGLQIELQFRSWRQHAWATAVETVGTFLQQALKASEGPEQWLVFFAQVSAAFAIVERTPGVPGIAMSRSELKSSIRRQRDEIGVVAKLNAFGDALQLTEEEPSLVGAHYYLMVLDPGLGLLRLKGFGSRELVAASQEYLDVERSLDSTKGQQAVLVSAVSVESLKRGYPNYFLDTSAFVAELNRVVG